MVGGGGGGCQLADMLNKEASTLLWGWGGTGNQQTCWTEASTLWQGGGGWGGCQPADMLNKEASTLLWWGEGGRGLSTSRHAEQRPVPCCGGGGGGAANKQAKQRGQYFVVGVPTSKLNKEASTLLWRWTARRLWLSHNQHAGGPWSCFQIVHCDGPRFHMLCLQPSETVPIHLFPLIHTPLIPLDFTCFVSSPLKQYQFISFLLFTHLLFLENSHALSPALWNSTDSALSSYSHTSYSSSSICSQNHTP